SDWPLFATEMVTLHGDAAPEVNVGVDGDAELMTMFAGVCSVMVPVPPLAVLSERAAPVLNSVPATAPLIVATPGVDPVCVTLNSTVSISPPERRTPPPIKDGWTVGGPQPADGEKVSA